MDTAGTVVDVVRRNNVVVSGRPDGRPIVFVHGFGCNQAMWRRVAPAFEPDHRVVCFDNVGAAGSDLSAYHPGKYDSLHGYAADLLEILDTVDAHDAIVVGHSVSAMTAALAANRDPSRIGALVMLGPSPRYIDTDDYVGGFSQEAIDGLLDSLDANYLAWSQQLAPVIMGNPDRPELGRELTESFCATDPAIARHFARVTFLSDHRQDLPEITAPTLVVQTVEDVIAPPAVGRYVHAAIPGSTYVEIPVVGHLPHLSGPAHVIAAIRGFEG